MIVKYLQQSIENDRELQKIAENCKELQRIAENCSNALAAPRPDCVFFFPRHRSRRREGPVLFSFSPGTAYITATYCLSGNP